MNIKNLTILFVLFYCCTVFSLDGGALEGHRYRVIVSSDIGGSDEDDLQSFVHYLIYSDLFDTEGFISSPPDSGRKKDFFRVIDLYEKDYPVLSSFSGDYPAPGYLRSITKQGAVDPAPDCGYSSPTRGSEWIIQCAGKDDARPLYILVWGSITDVAQALHDDPSIKNKIRVHFIASWNRRQDENAFAYIEKNYPDLWIIQDETTFRGWYTGGIQNGDLDNSSFINEYLRGHGALGDFFTPLKNNKIKMGDTPTVARLLRGNPNDPTGQSWGGQFIRKQGRPNWFIDNPDPVLQEANYPGAKTVNKWRQDYLRDWAERMKRYFKK
ncbi:DUF1593 domain-containing protein [candidate division KSB1 bacterium]|nr:DUF1593 domain-containing protein [candidate division KSB1 bacterium]